MLLKVKKGLILGAVVVVGFVTSGGLSEASDHRTQFPGETFSPGQRTSPSAGNQNFPGETFRPGQPTRPSAGNRDFPGETFSPGQRAPSAGNRGSRHPDGYYQRPPPR